jgi:hypothetical protein
MPKRHNCQARQYGDQMICAPCGLNWDVNDPEPPECRKNIKRATARVAKIEAEALPVIPHRHGQGRLPDELPPDLATEMVKTYQANARDGLKGQIAGMQAAYRLFLDRVEL